jgi:hypothetical protein
MHRNTKAVVGGAVIGTLAAGMLAIPNTLPPSIAQEQPMATLLKSGEQLLKPPLDAAGLVKPEPRFIPEPSVEMDILSSLTVRKIGYGKTSFVEVTTTASGTYSSDGLASPHVRYPGLHPNPNYVASGPARVAILDGGAWVALEGTIGASFVELIPFKGGQLGINEDGSACVRVGKAYYC